MKENLNNLAGLYSSSDIDQVKVLLGSILPSGLTWDNSGRLNHQISPIFQAVHDADRLDFALGDPFALCFEHEYPIEFEIWVKRLMQMYDSNYIEL